MLSAHDYPRKKISRMKNPFESSQALDSNYSDSKISSNDSPKHYDRTKLSNVFQFNHRSRVLLSDSQLGSSVNNNESGENIYNFSTSKYQQKVQQLPQQIRQSIKSPTFPLLNNKQNAKEQNNTFTSPKLKQTNNQIINRSTNAQNYKKSPQYQTQTNTIKLAYQVPQVKMFKFEDRFSFKTTIQQNRENTQLPSSQHKGKIIYSTPQVGSKQQKRTFKPSLFRQLEEDNQFQEKNSNSKSSIDKTNQQPTTSEKLHEPFSFQIQRKSVIPKSSSRVNEQVSDQNIDIFISPSQHQSIMAKDKQKANILEEQKLNLSAGSQVHSYTDTILDQLRDKLGPPNQRIQIPFQSKNTHPFKKEINQTKKIIESKVFHQEPNKYGYSQHFKPNMSKKPRKRIFQPQTEKASHNYSTNYTKTPRTHYSPYVSQFQRQRHSNQRDISPSQILMKSLNIIDKMATEKPTCNQSHHSKNQSQVVVVPPAPLTITQSQPNSFNIYSPSPEQMNLRKQILDLNFEVSTIQTTFDLQKFDSRELQIKLKYLNEASAKLFEKFKNLISNDQMMNFQSPSNAALKQQILLLRQNTTKLINFQQKYIQTKEILASLEDQIKDILLLSSKQKYKKIKLVNEAIKVIQKTETYLSLQISKIPVIIKTFVNKEKLLLQQLRDWLKQCINKQNAL